MEAYNDPNAALLENYRLANKWMIACSAAVIVGVFVHPATDRSTAIAIVFAVASVFLYGLSYAAAAVSGLYHYHRCLKPDDPALSAGQNRWYRIDMGLVFSSLLLLFTSLFILAGRGLVLSTQS